MADSKENEMEVDEETVDVEEEEKTEQDVLLRAAELRFTYRKTGDKAVEEELMKLIREHNMVSLYQETFKDKINVLLLDSMKKNVEAKRRELEEAKESAEKQEGDVEIHDRELDMARHLALTSDMDTCIDAFLNVKGLTSGKNIDKYLRILRICLAYSDSTKYKLHSQEATKLIEKGGDWDRRNRFRVYNGVHYFRIRDFEKSAQCFLDAISTFTAEEIFDYKRLVYYTTIAAVVSLPRVEIKSKIIDSPEIRQVILELPDLQDFLNSFYNCQYRQFFVALLKIMEYIKGDMHLSVHADYYLREIRLRAYNQFLRSYLSVKLETMASEFGVSEQFLDRELSSFIVNDRISCTIDQINGVAQMKRNHPKKDHFNQIVKKGDALLTRVQRLSRVITY